MCVCVFIRHVGNVLQIQMPMSIIVPDDGTICIVEKNVTLCKDNVISVIERRSIKKNIKQKIHKTQTKENGKWK